jgi:hypothetical protein
MVSSPTCCMTAVKGQLRPGRPTAAHRRSPETAPFLRGRRGDSLLLEGNGSKGDTSNDNDDIQRRTNSGCRILVVANAIRKLNG